jgi:hypothetical protein
MLTRTSNADPEASILPKVLTLSAAVILAALSAETLGLLGQSIPTLLTPLPFPWVWLPALSVGVLAMLRYQDATLLVPFPPTLLTAISELVAPVALATLFCIWCRPLFSGKPTGRKRTRATVASITLLSALWFYGGWDLGLKYQDYRYTLTTALGSLAFAILSAILVASSRRTGSFAWSLTVNFLIFAWAVTYAFPYLGELP